MLLYFLQLRLLCGAARSSLRDLLLFGLLEFVLHRLELLLQSPRLVWIQLDVCGVEGIAQRSLGRKW